MSRTYLKITRTLQATTVVAQLMSYVSPRPKSRAVLYYVPSAGALDEAAHGNKTPFQIQAFAGVHP